MGWGSTSLAIKYLGIPLGANYKELITREPVVNRVEKRFWGWKRRLLSKGERLTLIKCTLSNLRIYYLSLLAIPTSVAEKLESLQNRFLWGDTVEHKRYHLVAWNELKKWVQCGGLAIRSLVDMNKVLQGKWLCRFIMEECAFWYRLITAKFGVEEKGWYTGGALRSHGRSLWKKISDGKGNSRNTLSGLRVEATEFTSGMMNGWVVVL